MSAAGNILRRGEPVEVALLNDTASRLYAVAIASGAKRGLKLFGRDCYDDAAELVLAYREISDQANDAPSVEEEL